MIGNDRARFGLVTRALHWIMAAGLLATLPLGLYIARMEPALSTIWLYGLHKTIGLTLLVLVVIRIQWHMFTPPPCPLPDPDRWAEPLARATHRALYLLLVVVPAAGWIASSASGIETVVFGRFTVPAIAPASPALEEAAFRVHRLGAWALGALVVLHMAGAARRTIRGDGTLRRMTLGTSQRG